MGQVSSKQIGLLNADAIQRVMCQFHGLGLRMDVRKVWQDMPKDDPSDEHRLTFYILVEEGLEDLQRVSLRSGVDLRDFICSDTKSHLQSNADTGHDLDVRGYYPLFQKYKIPALMQFYKQAQCLLLGLECEPTLALSYVCGHSLFLKLKQGFIYTL